MPPEDRSSLTRPDEDRKADDTRSGTSDTPDGLEADQHRLHLINTPAPPRPVRRHHRSLQAAPELPWDRVAGTEQARRAVAFLCRELEDSQERRRALRSADRHRLHRAVELVVLALFEALNDSHGVERRFSRASSDYAPQGRYGSGVTRATALSVVGWLEARGYAATTLGYYRKSPFGGQGGRGEQSRVWGTEALRRFLEDDFGLDRTHVAVADWSETIILRADAETRDEPRKAVEYDDTEETIRLRANLARINSALAAVSICLEEEGGSVSPLRLFRLRRIFSRGSFHLGGRFYGGPWQVMPRKDRQRLLIDGEEVVELDYSSLHPRLMYALGGLPVPSEDPYTVRGWSEAGDRELAKQAFQQLLNAGPGAALKKPLEVPAAALQGRPWGSLAEALEAAHAPLVGWFRSGRGLELQRLDSDIAEGVMLEMVEKGIPCLPVHDSFVVPASAKTALHRGMVAAYQSRLAERGVKAETPAIK